MHFLIGRYRDLAGSGRIVRHDKLKRSKRSVPCVVVETGGRELWIDEQRFLVLFERFSKFETLTWKVAELNPAMAPGTFAFAPPKNAKQVAALVIPPPELPELQ